MLLELGGLEEKLTTVCVGHMPGRCVIVQLPAIAEPRRDALSQMLYPRNTVIVRYLSEGTVVGFSSGLMKCIKVPLPLVFLSYPKRLESYTLRRHRRVACCLPGCLHKDTAILSGMLLDLSLSGCQFSAQTEEMGTSAVAVDEILTLHCDVFGAHAPDSISCTVKRVTFASSRLNIGLKFRAIPQQLQPVLTDYLHLAQAALG